MRRSQAINAVGAVFTAVVLVVVFATKVAHGAWIAVIAMVVLFIAMRAINRYYGRVTVEVAADADEPRHPAQPGARPGADLPAAQARAARAGPGPGHPSRTCLTAVTFKVEDDETRRAAPGMGEQRDPGAADRAGGPLPGPAPPADRLRQAAPRRANPRTVIMVFIPEYVVTQWWQQLLHNQSALRFKARLLFTPGVVVVRRPLPPRRRRPRLARRPARSAASAPSRTIRDATDNHRSPRRIVHGLNGGPDAPNVAPLSTGAQPSGGSHSPGETAAVNAAPTWSDNAMATRSCSTGAAPPGVAATNRNRPRDDSPALHGKARSRCP